MLRFVNEWFCIDRFFQRPHEHCECGRASIVRPTDDLCEFFDLFFITRFCPGYIFNDCDRSRILKPLSDVFACINAPHELWEQRIINQ